MKSIRAISLLKSISRKFQSINTVFKKSGGMPDFFYPKKKFATRMAKAIPIISAKSPVNIA